MSSPGGLTSNGGCPALLWVSRPRGGSTTTMRAEPRKAASRCRTIGSASSKTLSRGVPIRTTVLSTVLSTAMRAAAEMPWPTTSPTITAVRPSSRAITSYQSPPNPMLRPAAW